MQKVFRSAFQVIWSLLEVPLCEVFLLCFLPAGGAVESGACRRVSSKESGVVMVSKKDRSRCQRGE